MPGIWETAQVGGHDCHVFRPTTPNEHGYVVMYLHGVHMGRLADHPAFVEQFERHGLPVVAPVTQRSWWTDKICPEFDEAITAEQHVLNNVMPWIEQQFNAAPPKIALLGTSMGGQGALRLAYRHPARFPVVAAISPAVDYHLRWDQGDETLPTMYRDAEQARQDTALLHIHPMNWPRNQFFCCCPEDEMWYIGVDRLAMKLGSIGIPYECDLDTRGGGHGFAYYEQMVPTAIEFIVERLRKERLRVV